MGGVQEKKTVTTLDKIRKYYLKGPDAARLSEKQEDIRVFVEKAWNLLINYHSKEQATKVLIQAGASRANAYRYINYAQSVFGNPAENHQAAERYLILEDLMRLQQRAIKDGDSNLELKVIAQRIKIAGFDKDKDPKFDPEKLQAQIYIIKPHASVVAAMEAARDGGNYNFNTANAEDIDWLDLPSHEFKKEEEPDED